MNRPRDPYGRPYHSREHRIHSDPTWTGIFIHFLIIAAIPVLLWTVSQPVTGSIALALVVVGYIGARRVTELLQCFSDCGGFAFNLGGKIEVCITQPGLHKSH